MHRSVPVGMGLIWANGALEIQWLTGYGLRQVKIDGVKTYSCLGYM